MTATLTQPNAEPKPILGPHYKVRIVLPGAILHFASYDEPKWIDGTIHANWLFDPEYGDTLLHINWNSVIAASYRWFQGT